MTVRIKPVFNRALAILAIVSPLVAQIERASPDQVASSRPIIPSRIPLSKPAEVLQFASAKNGVDAPSAKPWHVKLTYDQFDEHGGKIHSGSAEEYYVSAKKYRLSFTTDEMSQTDVANESGLYRSGEQRWLNPAELQVLNEALRPFYRLELKPLCWWQLSDPCTRPDKVNWNLGGLKLHCIIIDRIDTQTSDNALPKYCFENDLVPLRYTRGRGSDETTYNSYLSFQDRYVASEIAVTRFGRMFFKIHIQELGSLDQVDEALFKPIPGSSGPLGGRITLSDDILFNYYLTHHALPEFPHRLNGNPTVTVRFVVGKNGRVLQADALDGPEILHKPCLDAVWKWQFRPYLILGEPVEVESQTKVQFPTWVGTWGR